MVGLNRNKSGFAIIAISALAFAIFRYLMFASGQMYIDEQIYSRLGYSLIQGHLATGSSFFSLYQQYGLNTSAINTPYGNVDSVQPWLDHPPLVGFLLIPFLSMNLLPRALPIALSTVVSVVVYRMARDYGEVAGIFAFVAFTAFTLYTPLLSMVFLDSSVSLFFILTVFLTVQYFQNSKNVFLYFAGVTAGLAAASKLTGVAAFLFLLLAMVYARAKNLQKPPLTFLKTVLIGALFPAVWFAYGFLTEPSLFVRLIQDNMSRSIFSGNILSIFSIAISSWTYGASEIAKTGIDSVLVLALIPIVYLLLRREAGLVLISFIALWVSAMAISYSWVFSTIPFYPIYAIGIGILTNELVSTLRRAIKEDITGQLRSRGAKP